VVSESSLWQQPVHETCRRNNEERGFLFIFGVKKWMAAVDVIPISIGRVDLDETEIPIDCNALDAFPVWQLTYGLTLIYAT